MVVFALMELRWGQMKKKMSWKKIAEGCLYLGL